jgi:hypothetical protein
MELPQANQSGRFQVSRGITGTGPRLSAFADHAVTKLEHMQCDSGK